MLYRTKIIMETYYGVIYYKNGAKEQTGTFSGAGADQQCERHTSQLFAMKTKMAVSDMFKPTRYEVKKKIN